MKHRSKKAKTFDKRIVLKNLTSQSPETSKKKKRKVFVANEEEISAEKKRSRAFSKDRISELPEPIVHHILSLLPNPKDIARTRILSTRWRDIHNSFNVFKFDQRNFTKSGINQHNFSAAGNQRMDLFSNYVTRALESHHHQNGVIQKIELNMTSYGLSRAESVDRWLSIASESKIRELDLSFPKTCDARYYLCTNVFTISTLTSLRLFRCKLGPCGEIKLPNLRKLCLGNINVSGCAIQNLICSSPLIEDLRFIYCRGLKTLRVTGLVGLNKLELHQCHLLKTIQVDAPNLQTFWHYGKNKHPNLHLTNRYHLDACTSLRSLTLKDSTIKSGSLEKLLSNFPLLETLELSRCDSLMDTWIVSPSLKRLVLRECERLTITYTDTPNLNSIDFKGNLKECERSIIAYTNTRTLNSIEFEGNLHGVDLPFESFTPYVLKEAKFILSLKRILGNVDNERVWHSRLCDYLGRFNHLIGLILVIHSKKDVIVHEDLKEILIPPARDFTIEVVGSSKRLEDVLESYLQARHPKTLYVVSSVDGALLQLVSGMLLKRDADPKCCERRTLTNKCWRHFLKRVMTKSKSIKLSGVNKLPFYSSWFESSPSVLEKTTSFRFTWNPKSKGRMLK